MADEQKNALQDEQLEDVSGGTYYYHETNYVHKGCGGAVERVDSISTGIFNYNTTYYKCTVCGEVFPDRTDTPSKYFDVAAAE